MVHREEIRKWLELVGGALLAPLLLTACGAGDSGSSVATAPDSPALERDYSLRANSPSVTKESPAKLTLARRLRLARLVALSLRDDTTRAALRQAFRTSPYPEGKVELQKLLASNPALENRIFGGGPGLMSARTDLAGESFEIYMPVDAHRASWTGGPEVLVVAQGDESENPTAFSPDGSSRVLSLQTIPSTPVIVINAAEFDFRAAEIRRISSLISCDDPNAISCDGGGGGGGTPPGPPRPGLYIRALQLAEDHETFTNGDPELEIIPFFPVGVLRPDSVAESAGCAGQGGISDRFFDANGTTWSGRAMLIPEDTLELYRATFPNRAFRINVHEDDSESCRYKVSDVTEKQLILGLDLLFNGITAGVKGIGNPGIFAFKAALSFGKAVDVINQNSDDIHGYLVAREQVTAVPPSANFNWAIMRTRQLSSGPTQVLAGWAQLEYVAP